MSGHNKWSQIKDKKAKNDLGRAKLFSKMNSIYYAGLDSAVMFRTVGDFLKHGLEKGYIEENDLYTTDKKVLEKMTRHLKKEKYLNRPQNY